MIGKGLGQSRNDYGENAGIVCGLFLAPKNKYYIVVIKIGVIFQQLTFKTCDQNIRRVDFIDVFDLEDCKIVRKLSKLNSERELYGVKNPHRIIDFEKCPEDAKCHSCFIDPKTIFFVCELCESCDKCLKKVTQIK